MSESKPASYITHNAHTLGLRVIQSRDRRDQCLPTDHSSTADASEYTDSTGGRINGITSSKPWKLQLSRFEANNVSRAISNAVSQPSRTQMWQGNGTAHWLVSSKPEASESQASTHMYNCRRARFGAPAWAILQHPPVVTSPLLRGGLLVVLSPSIRTRLRRSSLLYRHRLPSRWPSRSSIDTSGLVVLHHG